MPSRKPRRSPATLNEKGMKVVPYIVGRKGVSYYRFRGREMGGAYTGFTDQPTYADAKRIGEDLLASLPWR
jgi:F-type H+-transporting ATPase subunit gamma